MSFNFEDLKNLIPIFTVILSAIIAYFFGAINEKKKKYSNMIDQSLEKIYSEMYSEVVKVFYRNTVRTKKKFIVKYFGNNELYKLYDEEVINLILLWGPKIENSATFDEQELNKAFKKLAILIENGYWDRLKVHSQDLRWQIREQNMSNWFSIPLKVLFRMKDFLENISVFWILGMLFVFSDALSNNDRIIPVEYSSIFWPLGFLMFLLYIAILFLYFTFSNNKSYKMNRLIK